jgi:hypothetical protein
MITQSYGRPHNGVHYGQAQIATTPANFVEPAWGERLPARNRRLRLDLLVRSAADRPYVFQVAATNDRRVDSRSDLRCR